MGERGERRASTLAQQVGGIVYTPYAMAGISEERKWAQSNWLLLSSPHEGRTVQIDGAVHMVGLRAGTCTCGRYQRNGVPCGHAMACIFHQGLTLDVYLPPALSTATWAITYKHALPTMDISDLEAQEEEECNPPLTRVP